jgi:hypothetical protein
MNGGDKILLAFGAGAAVGIGATLLVRSFFRQHYHLSDAEAASLSASNAIALASLGR